MQIGDVAVGGVVQMNVQGVQTNFRVMHHGKPSAIYDDSWLDGTVIMLDWMESPYYQNVSSGLPSKYNYAESAAHALLSEIWFTYLDSTVQRLVREVKLPYRTDVDGAPYVVASGANGVAAKVWLPSVVEVARGSGYESNQSSFYVEEGAPFDFWKGADAAKYADWAFVSSSGTDNGWATRTMNKQTSGTGANYYNWVGKDGLCIAGTRQKGNMRPCMVLPSTTTLGESIVAATASFPVKVGGIWRDGTASVKCGGIWRTTAAASAKISGVWKQ